MTIIHRSSVTQSKEEQKVAAEKTTKKPEPEVVPVKGKSNTEVLRAINRQFYEESWTDGFPIMPPT